MWNRALEEFTEINSADVVGSQLSDLPEPWLTLLEDFIGEDIDHSYKQSFELAAAKRTVNLHKALIEESGETGSNEGLIILMEDMTETEILEAGLTHSERLASIGRLAAGVAHEIGNPITGIACLAQIIRDEYKDSELTGLAQQIIEQTDRTSKILQSLVNFAHAGTNKLMHENERVLISECIAQAQTLVSLDKKNKELQLEIDCDAEAAILGDSQRLLQVLINLINNARDASQAGGTIVLAAKSMGSHIHISVTDFGVGIPNAIKSRVFDPFFTTKEAGEGTGLGLSLVFSIVEDLNGNIDIISPFDRTRGTGTQVLLKFPCYDPQLAETSA
jgi:signal transduction histidine kinase